MKERIYKPTNSGTQTVKGNPTKSTTVKVTKYTGKGKQYMTREELLLSRGFRTEKELETFLENCKDES